MADGLRLFYGSQFGIVSSNLCGIAIVAFGSAAILASGASRMGNAGVADPRPRLRDFIPQTPFLASRGKKHPLNQYHIQPLNQFIASHQARGTSTPEASG